MLWNWQRWGEGEAVSLRVIGQALVKADNPTGPVYGGVVVSEPWESKDDLLIFPEVSYLQAYSLMVIQGL
jgi:hypothetical protein